MRRVLCFLSVVVGCCLNGIRLRMSWLLVGVWLVGI